LAIDYLTPMLDVVFIIVDLLYCHGPHFVKRVGIDVNRPEAATAAEKREPSQYSRAISGTKGFEIWITNVRIDVRAVQAILKRLKA